MRSQPTGRLDLEGLEDGVAAAQHVAAIEAADATAGDAWVARALALGPPRGRALDAACGSGRRALLLARAAPGLAIVAVEMALPLIRQARDAAHRAGMGGRITILRADPKRLPFHDGAFDLVLSIDLLHRLSAALPALNEFARVARAGGALLIADSLPVSQHALPWSPGARRLRGLPRPARQSLVEGLRHAASESALADLLRRSRLRGVAMRREGRTHVVLQRPAASS